MPEIDGLELMQMCKEEFPDIKFVIFLCMKISVMHRLRFVWGRWTISRRSVFPRKSVNRYWSGSAQSTGRQAETGRQTGKTGKTQELSRRWMYTGWIFNEKEFEDLCRETKEISLRSAERIFVKSFHDIQILSGGEGEFPSLDTVEEMLDWVRRWQKTSMKYAAVRRRKMISVRLLLSSCMWMSTSGRSCALKTRLNRSG